MLGKRLDREKSLAVPSAIPVGQQLLGVQRRPLLDEAQRAGRQPADEDLAAEAQRRLIARLTRVEVRLGVDAFVEVHPDRDSVGSS
jgi:hypothetical protein